ncbi:hypothetical protein ON010_g14217 [Phytophthora cinnamomi]|nr:hypothetical protein ON010_g14217 [Phytophthora cinnamomi]
MFLLAPNIVGVSLSATQMMVTYIYRSKEPRQDQITSTSSEDIRDMVDLVVVQQDHENDHDIVDVLDCQKNPSFVAMRSPCNRDSKSWEGLKPNGRQE